MSMQLVCDWVTPCLLCEDPTDHVTVYRNPETGAEQVTRVPLPHLCEPLRQAMREARGGAR